MYFNKADGISVMFVMDYHLQISESGPQSLKKAFNIVFLILTSNTWSRYVIVRGFRKAVVLGEGTCVNNS